MIIRSRHSGVLIRGLKLVAVIVIAAVVRLVGIGALPSCYAQAFELPAPGSQVVALSPSWTPPLLKGMKVYPQDPFRLDFILTPGDSPDDPAGLARESARLIRYFLAALTIPDEDLWVNLSPDEEDRVIPEAFGQTEMGRDLLAMDYLLKQIMSSLINPGHDLGRQFWDRVFAQAEGTFASTDLPVQTFHKVWIVPLRAQVYESSKDQAVYVLDNRFAVMLEKDYLAGTSRGEATQDATDAPESSSPSRILKEIVIPALTDEVNHNTHFARLRQIHNSLVLARWFKAKVRESLWDELYLDRAKVDGITYQQADSRQGAPEAESASGSSSVRVDRQMDPEGLYKLYLQSFQDGAEPLVREEYDHTNGQIVSRQYFSGGMMMVNVGVDRQSGFPVESDRAMLVQVQLRDPALVQPRWQWPGVSFQKMNPVFRQWVESEAIDQDDLLILKEILSGDLRRQDELVRQYSASGKVAIKFEDRDRTDGPGRTMYLTLNKPLSTAEGEITMLRIKGAQPKVNEQTGEVEPNRGRGSLSGAARIRPDGEIYYLRSPIDKPQGTMSAEMAAREYEMLETGWRQDGFHADYPVALVSFSGLSYKTEPVGFVISGMRAKDLRLTPKLGEYGERLSYVDILTGEFQSLTMEEEKAVYKEFGRSIRALHRAGYIYGGALSANFGIEKIDGQWQIIIRDFEFALTQTEVQQMSEAERQLDVITKFRLLDLDRLLLRSSRIRNLDHEFKVKFLEGYFGRLDPLSQEFKDLVWNSVDIGAIEYLLSQGRQIDPLTDERTVWVNWLSGESRVTPPQGRLGQWLLAGGFYQPQTQKIHSLKSVYELLLDDVQGDLRSAQSQDAAVLARRTDDPQAQDVGGIDLTAARTPLEIHHEGDPIIFDFFAMPIPDFSGLAPVILKVDDRVNLPEFFGTQ